MVQGAVAVLLSSGLAVAQCAPTWLPPLSPSPYVRSLAVTPKGDLLVGGLFQTIAGVSAQNIARWDGTAWSPLGSGINGTVSYLEVAPNGDVIAGGVFTQAGGVAANNIARWDGLAWSPLGTGTYNVRALAVRSTGEILVAAGTVPMRWNGSTWTQLPDLWASHFRAALTLPNDDVLFLGDGYINSTFTPAAIARWNGTAFDAMGGYNFGEAQHAIVRRNGDLVVGGIQLMVASGDSPLVRWNGTAFVPVDPTISGTVMALAELPNGDLLVAGTVMRGSQLLGHLLRWDGATWSLIAGDLNLPVNKVAVDGRGRIVAAGPFTASGGQTLPGFAWTSVPCPASVLAYGSGCVSAAGPVTLTADNLPFAGAVFRSSATGMAASSLAVHAIGLQPLSQPLPLAAPGCLALVDPLHSQLVLTASGSCRPTLALPNSAAFAGINLLTQVVQLELDASGSRLVGLSATNGLVLTIGAL